MKSLVLDVKRLLLILETDDPCIPDFSELSQPAGICKVRPHRQSSFSSSKICKLWIMLLLWPLYRENWKCTNPYRGSSLTGNQGVVLLSSWSLIFLGSNLCPAISLQRWCLDDGWYGLIHQSLHKVCSYRLLSGAISNLAPLLDCTATPWNLPGTYFTLLSCMRSLWKPFNKYCTLKYLSSCFLLLIAALVILKRGSGHSLGHGQYITFNLRNYVTPLSRLSLWLDTSVINKVST